MNLDINTIDAENASNKMACVAINARFLRRNGTYCQLVFSRSKVVPDGLSQPRAELLAATLNAHICETVKRAFTLAYSSIVNKIHWHLDAAKHSVVETVWRYILKLGYIMLVGSGIVVRIGRFLVQTPLGTRLGLGTQPHYKLPGDLRVKNVFCSD